MSKKLIITKHNDFIINSVFENNEMIEVEVNDNNDIRLGNIYIGRVENVVKNINSAFVEIAKGVKCYYSIDDNRNHFFLNKKNNNNVNIGDLLLVQVSKEGIKTKLPSVTSDINFSGKYIALVTDGSKLMFSNKIKDSKRKEELKELLSPIVEAFADSRVGFIVRTNAYEADNSIIAKEAEKLANQFKDILCKAQYRTAFTLMYSNMPSYINDINNMLDFELEEIITDEADIYDTIKEYLDRENSGIADKLKFYNDILLPLNKLYRIGINLNNALNKKVWLKSGGYLVIEPTEALTVIDVNTGKFTAKKNQKENTFMKINLEAVDEIAKQIRLRNLSGIIIVDFINMDIEQNKAVLMNTLEQRLSKDKVQTKVVDMTQLELVEITRKKIRKPLHEAIPYQERGCIEN